MLGGPNKARWQSSADRTIGWNHRLKAETTVLIISAVEPVHCLFAGGVMLALMAEILEIFTPHKCCRWHHRRTELESTRPLILQRIVQADNSDIFHLHCSLPPAVAIVRIRLQLHPPPGASAPSQESIVARDLKSPQVSRTLTPLGMCLPMTENTPANALRTSPGKVSSRGVYPSTNPCKNQTRHAQRRVA